MRPSAVPTPTSWPTPGSHGRFIEIPILSLTPIYRGGATTARIDVDRPFRVPSIRGMLRYWWRATSSITDVRALRQAEGELFGGVFDDKPVASSVTVAITEQSSMPAKRPNKPYVFGVAGRDPGTADQVHSGALGNLRIEWRDQATEREILRAIRAWLLFGGIGGRSRRGAGSVWWKAPGPATLPPPESVEALLVTARSLTPVQAHESWPTLSRGAILIGPDCNGDSDAAWNQGLNAMRYVRASQDVDACVLRRIGRPDDALDWKRADYLKFVKQLPFQSGRAALGLPIPFNGTAGRFILNATGFNRFPSPIHLKVVRLAGGHRPMFTILRTPMPHNLSFGGTVDRDGVDRFISLAGRLDGWTRHDLRGAQ